MYNGADPLNRASYVYLIDTYTNVTRRSYALITSKNQRANVFTCLFAVTRIQFYAVEIARNRRGLNKHLLEKSPSTQESEER